MNKFTLSDIAKLLQTDEGKSDKHFYGKVAEVITSGDTVKGYRVSLDGNLDNAITCRKLVGAEVGDIVMVTLQSNGLAVVTNRLGGDKDAFDAIEQAASAQNTAAEADEKAQSVVDMAEAGKFDGEDGQTYYTWIRYADDAQGGGISDDPTGKDYIGFSYNQDTPIESSDPSDYTWSLIKGTDGVPGQDGEDGQTFYTWIKYSDVLNPTASSQIYDIPTSSTIAIGIAVNKASQTESTNPNDYTWSKFKGDQGVPGESGQDGRGISSTTIEYAKSNNGNTAPTSGWQSTIPTLTDSEPYLWAKTHIVYTSGSPASTDIYAVSKKGEKGDPGSPGTPGAAGRGILSIVEQWARGTSSAAQSSSWSTTPPLLTSSYPVLWYRQQINWTNPTETTYAPSSSGVKSTMINELVTFRNLVANDDYTMINGGSIDTSTLYLGRIQNGTGNYAQVDSSGLHVYRSNANVANFGSNKIELGNNTTGSTITMCGSVGEISADYTRYDTCALRLESVDIYDSSVRAGILLDAIGGLVEIEAGVFSFGEGTCTDLFVNNNLYIEGITRANGHIVPMEADAASLGTTNSPWHNVIATSYIGLVAAPTSGSQAYEAIWHKTTTGNYWLYRPSSARRWKNSIKDVEEENLNPNKLYDLPVRQFKWNDTDAFDDEIDIGFIADEVAEIYPRAASFDTDDDGDEFACDWNHRRLLPAMLKLIQDQHKEIELLKERLN